MLPSGGRGAHAVIRAATVALAAVLLAAACGTGVAIPPSVAPTTAATSVATLAPTSPPTAAPTTAARTCPNPEGGLANTCLGLISAGTYTTKTFGPTLTYSVPAGWANYEDLRGNFLLLPRGSSPAGVNPGTSDYLGVYTSVVAAGHCTGTPSSTVASTFDGLAGWLKKDPALTVTNVHDVAVGRLAGVVMDIVMKGSTGDGCPDGSYADVYVGKFPSSLIHGVVPNYGLRVYLLQNGTETLAIEVADATKGGSDYPDWYKAAGDVIKTFIFGPS
jgi:hypothetical protein